MAMEINSKQLHKHALPVLIVLGLLIAAAGYVSPRSVQALFGQPLGQPKTLPDISRLGQFDGLEK